MELNLSSVEKIADFFARYRMTPTAVVIAPWRVRANGMIYVGDMPQFAGREYVGLKEAHDWARRFAQAQGGIV